LAVITLIYSTAVSSVPSLAELAVNPPTMLLVAVHLFSSGSYGFESGRVTGSSTERRWAG